MFLSRKVYSLFSQKASSLLPKSKSIYTRPIASFSSRTPTRMPSTLPRLPIFEAIASHDRSSPVVIHSQSGRRFTYGSLLRDVADAKEKLLEEAGGKTIEGERIAFLVENSYDYVVTLLSILGTHAIALPLSAAFPAAELQYILDQSRASMLLSSAKFGEKAEQVIAKGLAAAPKHVKLEKRFGAELKGEVILDGCEEGKGGMMLYTSGTTNRPKGVLLPQRVMTAQSQSLVTAWNYTPADHLLHVLPLHHIHGTVNAILAPLLAGSTIEFLFPFNPSHVWSRFASPFLPSPKTTENITFFTVVPTVYNRLLSTFSSLPPETQTAGKTGIAPNNLRLAISGSAALPTPTRKAWSDLSSGNVLLERYGMTEVGMALSCGLSHATRIDGSVGFPLPSVQVRLVDTDTNEIIRPGEELDASGKERDGEIQLRGPTVFSQYWRNEKATRDEHVAGDDGLGPWFKTGDVAVRRTIDTSSSPSSSSPSLSSSSSSSSSTDQAEPQEWAQGPMYFIRGRKSADIIKSGGEKVSALEVEREMLALPQIAETAVVAVPSGKW
ncbi:Acyl-CoA synthetase family member 3, mitochondrial, partial [Lachnellula cervina]